jgi:chromosome segregation ATPase
MHQNMVEQFSVLSNVEKLRMVEAAVGLEPFRENVLQAQRKLTRILSQEESVGKLLENAEQTLSYWREQYEKYQEKKQLQTKRRFLERELAWAEVERREGIVKELEASRQREQESLNRIEEEAQAATEQLQVQQQKQAELKSEAKTAFNERLSLERGTAENESTIALYQQLLTEASAVEAAIKNSAAANQFKLLRTENLQGLMENSRQHLQKLTAQVKENQAKLNGVEEAVEKVAEGILDNRIRMALLQYRRENAVADLKRIDASLKDAKSHLGAATAKAEQSGARIAVLKSAMDVLDEIRVGVEGEGAGCCRKPRESA